MTDDLAPHRRLIQMGFAYRLSAMLRAAAAYRLADHLADGPRTAEAVAALAGAQPLALRRMMRALADAGVFTEDHDKRFALTDLGAALKSDAPGAARATLLFTVGEQHQRAWLELENTLRDGENGMKKAYGEGFFEFLAARPQKLALFNETMIGIHGADAPAIAEAFDFSRFPVIVDVGGGVGARLAAILARHPGSRGVLFDQPDVIADAQRGLAEDPAAGRISFVAGDFFKTIPGGGDAYVLSHVIHDWPEAECLEILRNCRAAMAPTSRLVLIEQVLPEGPAPHSGKMLDMTMMVMIGGRERTEAEYAELLAKAGFRVVGVTSTGTPASVIEAAPA